MTNANKHSLSITSLALAAVARLFSRETRSCCLRAEHRAFRSCLSFASTTNRTPRSPMVGAFGMRPRSCP